MLTQSDIAVLSKLNYESITQFYTTRNKHKAEIEHFQTLINTKDTKIERLEGEVDEKKQRIIDKDLEIGRQTAEIDGKDEL